ncbi:MAG: methionine synthase [Candidatus Thorarchaeota archaeon]
MFKKNIILTACIGQCVHVAGSYNFMLIARQLGYKTIFIGPATPISTIIDKINKFKPEIIGLSYRLTPKTVKPLLRKFFQQYSNIEEKPNKLLFAGTPEVVKVAKTCGNFDYYFVGGEPKWEILSILRNKSTDSEDIFQPPMDIISRIQWKKPYPIIRAHFGLPNLKDTIDGVQEIAESKVLDVISIAPDQNTQSHYFHPEDQHQGLRGAGGVPLRTQDDFKRLDEARMRGNYPLLRIYAGTRDFIKLGKLYRKTIRNAWAAIPIFWFNQMDGRGPIPLKESIRQHLHAIKWHAKNNIPVEINDPHHWSLRDSSDAIAVADMYLCGIIAKKLGVRHFIAQFMFNTPPNLTLDMDLAKILAKNDLLSTLVDKDFSVIRQVRTGLASFPLDSSKAKGQLATATMVQLALKPEIVHVVSYSEADHAAKPADIIESCKIVSQVIDRVLSSNLNFMNKNILIRKNLLIKQAQEIINLIPNLALDSDQSKDPFINPTVLNKLVKYGIFDAPHLKNNKFAKGELQTKIINGACYAWDSTRDRIYDEIERIKDIDNINNDFNLFKPLSKTRGFIG